MKITYELKRTLVSTAKTDVDTAQKKLDAANAELVQAEKTLWWAEGLVTGQELSMTQPAVVAQSKSSAPQRVMYFFPSKSGGKGHYIEKDVNTINCSCPGFINRGSCWATREILSGKNSVSRIWLWYRSDFERKRDAAIAEYN